MEKNDRKYIAVSIKHSEYRWKYGKPLTLWGWKQTEDNEKRCFSGYTYYPMKAERYALGEFKQDGYGYYIKDDEPVELCINFCKKYKKYDTVLVLAEKILAYYDLCGLAKSEPPKEDA